MDHKNAKGLTYGLIMDSKGMYILSYADTYVLGIRISGSHFISVGRLGKVYFKDGCYLYIGSARLFIRNRLRRHLLQNKKIFWHIDYLLSNPYAKIKDIWVSSGCKECLISQRFLNLGYCFIDNFGNSDCRCPSHLFYTSKLLIANKILKNEGYTKVNIRSILR